MASRYSNKKELEYAMLLVIGIVCILVSVIVSNTNHKGLINLNQIMSPAFALDDGEFRCTNGSTVDRPSECPSSDLCPSSSHGNRLSQCITNEPSSRKEKAGENNEKRTKDDRNDGKDNSDKQTSKKRHSISIFTDKYNYEKGEVIEIIVKNSGARSFTFSDSDSNIKIRNLKTDKTFLLPSSVPDKFTLDSGDSKKFKWNQEDDEKEQVNSDKYRVSVSVGSLRDTDTFVISR